VKESAEGGAVLNTESLKELQHHDRHDMQVYTAAIEKKFEL
jgi:hypothetical protein